MFFYLTVVIYAGTLCLRQLKRAGNAVQPPVLAETCARLMVGKCDTVLRALPTQLKHPYIVADARPVA